MLTVLLLFSFFQISPTQAASTKPVTADDLITLVNNWRVGYGLQPLIVDPILMASAYDTAVTMAVNGMRSHIGNVSGRIAAYGYGGGAQVFATENFAVGPVPIETIASWWMDEQHQYPSSNPNYVHIGAGVYQYGDRTWYVVHAAYTSADAKYTPNPTQLANKTTSTPPVSQLIIPVNTVTPNQNGAVIHEVLPGQALWSIAIAYNTKIENIIRLNNLNPADPTIYIGDKLLIFEANHTAEPTVTTPTIDPSATTPTPSATITATRTKTRTATTLPTQVPVQVSATPTPTETLAQRSSFNGIFQNKVIGIVLVSILALGILMMVTGSFEKPPKPPDHKDEDSE